MHLKLSELEILSKYIKSIGIVTELYYEINDTFRIRIREKNIEDISKSQITGGQIRYFSSGKKMKRVFNCLKDVPLIYKEIMRDERYWGPYDKEKEYKLFVYEDKNIPKNEKMDEIVKRLFDINKKMLCLNQVESTIISYGNSYKTVVFINSKGKIIIQKKRDSISNFAVTKKEENIITYPVSLGSGRKDYYLKRVDEYILNPLKKMSQEPFRFHINSGTYTLLLDPLVSGTLIHEVLGHLLEADTFLEHKELLKEFEIGKRIATCNLTIRDCPTLPGLRGSYKFDDEGTPANDTILVENGILKNYLHSNETAKIFGVKSTGNARQLNYKYSPIVRMSNISVDLGKTNDSEMIKNINDGLLISGLKGAETNLKEFTIIPRETYLIKEGMIKGRCENIYINDNIDILKRIVMIGNRELITEGYSCNKYSQRGLPVSFSSPSICIEKCKIEVYKNGE